MLNITCKGGDIRQVAEGTTIDALCRDISMGLYRAACAAKLNGKTVDLRTPLTEDGAVDILTFDDEDGKKAYWHTTSHIMAQAVGRLWPGTKLTIGPSIDSGFYYDFDSEHNFSAEDLIAIEAEMKKIIKEALPIERFTLPRDEALALMKDEPYKCELITELPEGEEISFYRQGDFVDLCAGPHLPDTGRVKAVKLLSATGAYWRGDSKNKMLQRIYGIAFPKTADLQAHLEKLEEAKKRDHNKLGRELELFTTVDVIGQGLPILLPKGARIVQLLQRFVEDEEQKRNVRGVLLYVLEGLLKLLHPFMPFLTEEVYQHLPEHDGMLILARWPEVKAKYAFETEERQMEGLMEIIRAIRNLRAEMNVAAGKRTHLMLLPADGWAETLAHAGQYFQRLAGASETAIIESSAAVTEKTVSAVTKACTLYIPLGDLVDFEKEIARLSKELDNLHKEIARAEGKLNNPGFVSKAPAALVEQEKGKLALNQQKAEQVEKRIAELKESM